MTVEARKQPDLAAYAPLDDPVFTTKARAPYFKQTTQALGNVSGSVTVDLSLGAVVTMTLTGTTTITLTNPSQGVRYTMKINYSGGGGQALTFNDLFFVDGVGNTMTDGSFFMTTGTAENVFCFAHFGASGEYWLVSPIVSHD